MSRSSRTRRSSWRTVYRKWTEAWLRLLTQSSFFFSSRRRHTRYWRDWSSDVCSSDLGYFVMLNAPALAAFQVLIYVGAVTVVILFGIMFTQRQQVRRFRTIMNRQIWPGLFAAIGVGAFLAYVLSVQNWGSTAPGNGLREVADLGEVLLGLNGAPPILGLLFEVISILLLVAVIAAIVVSRRKTGEGVDQGVEE